MTTRLIVKNASFLFQHVMINRNVLTLIPGASKSAVLTASDMVDISSISKTYTGEPLKHRAKFSFDRSLTTIYLTNFGIQTNLSAGEGVIKNASNGPVIFVEVDIDGRRWPRCMSTPGNTMKAVIVNGSTWEIVTPERENVVLAVVRVPKDARTLTFNKEGELVAV